MLQCCIFQIHVSGNCPRMRQIANTSNFRFTSHSPCPLREVRDSILGFTSRSPFKSPSMCLQNWTYIAESVHCVWFGRIFCPFIEAYFGTNDGSWIITRQRALGFLAASGRRLRDDNSRWNRLYLHILFSLLMEHPSTPWSWIGKTW